MDDRINQNIQSISKDNTTNAIIDAKLKNNNKSQKQ